MASTSDSTVTVAVSRDGTEIGYSTSGDGPPLVLVHGTPADRTRWRPLLPYLEPHFTCYAVDRRGRGASGDGPAYALEREHEDVAAVIDAVAEATGSSVDVYGHSHGSMVAFGAAALTSNVRRLVLYEGWPLPEPEVYAFPADVEAHLDALLAAGDREGIVTAAFRALLQMSDEDIEAFRSAPSWPGRVAAAHTLTREVRAECHAHLDAEQAAHITAPVLLITGTESTDPARAGIAQVAAALPHARVLELEGHDHIADVAAPELFARHLLVFLREG